MLRLYPEKVLHNIIDLIKMIHSGYAVVVHSKSSEFGFLYCTKFAQSHFFYVKMI
jgi:hypothetical protein